MRDKNMFLKSYFIYHLLTGWVRVGSCPSPLGIAGTTPLHVALPRTELVMCQYGIR